CWWARPPAPGPKDRAGSACRPRTTSCARVAPPCVGGIAIAERLALQIFADVRAFAKDKGIPLGVNVESVSIRTEEIEASAELFEALSARMWRASRLEFLYAPPHAAGQTFTIDSAGIVVLVDSTHHDV